MYASEATRYQLETAVNEIVAILHSCTSCHRSTQDGESVAADSAADAVDLIDSAIRNQDLMPPEESHSASCECRPVAPISAAIRLLERIAAADVQPGHVDYKSKREICELARSILESEAIKEC